jgi:hypothetical protein
VQERRAAQFLWGNDSWAPRVLFVDALIKPLLRIALLSFRLHTTNPVDVLCLDTLVDVVIDLGFQRDCGLTRWRTGTERNRA